MHRQHHSWKRREAFSRHGYGYGFGHRGFGRGHARGGRIGRLLEHGDLRFVILALLKEKPGHGYEMIRALEERSGGAYRPSPGVIYPTLSLLEDEGFVRQTGEAGGRKAFEITEAGLAALEANHAGVEAVFARLDEAAAQSSSSRPRIARAMQNLGMALTLRLQRGEVTEAEMDAIVAALDEAAGKIERA